ncbi:MAG: inorganic phosphate transporter [Clostridia bacterium]|nr:inorganic phosphate transporter [Clostridia bacterium]
MDFTTFWGQMTSNPLLFMAIVLTLGVILVNGWTDAPNAIATCVVTRCMSARAAILMSAVFNFAGVFVMSRISPAVVDTITKMVDFGGNEIPGSPENEKAIIALSAALFAIVVWATAAWMFGIPTSESHALIAGLTGGALAVHNSLRGVNGGEWIKVVYGLGISLILGFVVGWCVCKIVVLLFKNVHRRKTEKFFRGAQIVGAASMSFMHGAQDGLKFMGVIYLCTLIISGKSTSGAALDMPIWIVALCSIIMALGTSLGGKKIIKSVGMDMVKLEKYQGFSADISASICLLLSSVFGIPVSTTHAKTTAIMGVGAVKRISAINFSVVKEMLVAWILTFPGCGLLAFVFAKIFMMIFL